VSDNQPIANLRREYTLAGLRRAEMDADPMAQLARWFQQAIDAKVPEPNAMTLATATKRGQPSARIVLLKGMDKRGLTFFTNYESRKGRELSENPNASAVLFWPELERQICIAGTVTKTSREESEKYFESRPKGSRLAAWVSNQSETIPSRSLLEKKLAQLEARYPGEEVALPPYWGGYRLAPFRMEFWQGRPDRLHDRFEYMLQMDNRWLIERLSP
jgi:pyridoxamine 5'-phosphate oxidase